MTTVPLSPGLTSRPVAGSTTSATTPGKGRPADPGFSGVETKGVIMIIPVSVCHQVSRMGRWPPVTRWNQNQASGFKGSPTDPRILRLPRSNLAGHSSPCRMRRRIVVGVE